MEDVFIFPVSGTSLETSPASRGQDPVLSVSSAWPAFLSV